MLRFKLPKDPYKCEGTEIVHGKTFVDGELIVSDDVGKMIGPALLHFYGVEVEQVEEIKSDEDVDPDADPSLQSSETQGNGGSQD